MARHYVLIEFTQEIVEEITHIIERVYVFGSIKAASEFAKTNFGTRDWVVYQASNTLVYTGNDRIA